MASLTSDINILGYSNRLPGANSPSDFWSLLETGTCAVTQVTPDRWPLARFGNPNAAAPGKAYTWAAGQLDDVWGFDPSFFGISPRETLQMDPQQRLLLQLVWEALEHANIRPSDLAGSSTGVYVGASSLDYHHRFVSDPAAADMQFMTGNTLSIVSNRISYIYDLRGPSFTVDTACSSSLVALHEAVCALESGVIDTAIVCGISLLLSPFAFVGFSRATMLSPTGLCQAFDAKGDGYVRSEGGVVLVLQANRAKKLPGTRAHARLVASGINADGRTVGLSLPSPFAQAALLRELYEDKGVDPSRLAFVEAHGTGTRVGDPAEADALGKVIGQKRAAALPIGSVKTNVGHLEPVSGLVGVLKAILALKHDLFPKSLHFDTPNPDIPFDELNLQVAKEPVHLVRDGADRIAGINSFGFGGTNAHAIIADAPDEGPADLPEPLGQPLLISARSEEALRSLAGRYREQLASAEGDQAAAGLVLTAAHARDLLAKRMVVLGDTVAEQCAALDSFLADQPTPAIVCGEAARAEDKTAFIFSGNGSQWAGMGQDAYKTDMPFQKAFEKVDKIFMGIGGWSLLTMLFAEDLETDIERAEVAQPLLFAIQVALVESLRSRGIEADGVAGHSVGEVAAAWCAGALSLDHAVKLIHARSSGQEVVRDLGSMAALLLPADRAQAAIKESGFPQLELAAINSPRSVTISGASESLEAFAKYARKNKWALRRLGLAYPFHSALVDPIREPLLNALQGIEAKQERVPFYSTVDPDAAPVSLEPEYWWRNVREPVRFSDAISRMAADGFGVFVEIGPRSVLGTYINDVVRTDGKKAQVLASLEQKKADRDETLSPVARVAAAILAHGGKTDLDRFVGAAPQTFRDLPHYPWQNTPYKQDPTEERVDFMFGQTWPLLGFRLRSDASVWYNHIDVASHPWLVDHKVEESVVFPAAGFSEMALRAVLRWTGQDAAELRDFDIFRPLVLDDGEAFETQVRISPDDRVVEVFSRRRLDDNDWSLHARGHYVTPSTRGGNPSLPEDEREAASLEKDALYAITRSYGLNYGDTFQRARSVVAHDQRRATVTLDTRVSALQTVPMALCPSLADAGFHGLFALLEGIDNIPEKTSFLPIRLGAFRLLQPDAAPETVRIEVTKASPRSVEATFEYIGADGTVIARLTKARFRAVKLGRDTRQDELVYHQAAVLLPDANRRSPVAHALPAGFDGFAAGLGLTDETPSDLDESSILLEALGRTVAHTALWSLADNGIFDVTALIRTNVLHETSAPLAHALVNWLADDELAVTLEDGTTRLADPAEGPSAHALMQTLSVEGGRHIAEAALLARLKNDLPDILRTGLPATASEFYSGSLFDAYTTASPSVMSRVSGLTDAATGLLKAWPKGNPARVLVVGSGASSLLKALDRTLDSTRMQVCVTDLSAADVGRAARLWTGSTLTKFVDPDGEALAERGPFDLVIFARSLADLSSEKHREILAHLTPDAGLLTSEALAAPLTDLLRGIGADWWSETVTPEFPISRQNRDWAADLTALGYTSVTMVALASQSAEADLIFAQAGERPQTRDETTEETPARQPILILCDESGAERKLADGLAACLTRDGQPARLLVPGSQTAERADGVWTVALCADQAATDTDPTFKKLTAAAGGQIVYLLGAYRPEDDALETLEARSANLMAVVKAIGSDPAALTVIVPGGAQDIISGQNHRPAQTGFWNFARVAMNEYPDANIRMIDVSPNLEPGIAAARLAEELQTPGAEREVVLDGQSRAGLRILQGGLLPDTELSQGAEPALRLEILRQGALDQLQWQPVARNTPGPRDVEISVEASGLNFRDVMWALGLLPEEALEDGFAGPTLGMECCGTVVSCGPDVTRFKPGDRVITFAPACFASHVTVHESGCAPMPSTVSSEEAATIPVTFLTAYYALVHLAHLSEGETVLIHGGAGGVGLAALQIAQWRGARIIATAGSPEKRATLDLLGADVVLDSRSLAFVDEVMDLTDGEGVDVVLNSLFGEAMERSIEVLKPFGRFLELGKRDYYGNTRIGLRPFRQNLTYFGIDADQLLTRQPKLAETLFEKLVALFEDQTLSPLPYRAFDAEDVVDAFRLMQQAGHIGKIVLRPPQVSERPAPVAQELTLNGNAVYIVAGGFGGFGAALLHRLVDKGARNIAVLSRRGSTSDEAQTVIGALAERGAAVTGYPCDITDPAAVTQTLDEIRAAGLPIKGVFHTAMVLDDRLITNLDAQALRRVMAPKVRGAELLDRLTAADPLDHFVLYSSATTLVGNPGQANYVAANGYLEALARKRRAAGKPGLAVAWGAISDAGYLARNEDVNEMLSRKLGRHALTAQEALDGLERLMTLPTTDPRLASIGYARIDWQAASKDLALVGTPLTDLLGLGSGDDDGGPEGMIDLHALLEGMDPVTAAQTVAKLLAAEIGKILRIAPEEIDPHKPLSEIGMDSLMALELRMSAERQLGIDIPLMSLANGATLMDLSSKVANRVLGGEGDSRLSADAQQLANQHVNGDDADSENLSELAEKVESKSRELGSFL
ncbi:type I polyketide synthase [Roseibium aquae]|uniref:Type I polyketide synthase n=1 Tax=Roseibium aquae TaxID=1323746 RepID=A0A916TJP4_9HYPH|nr:type I polyketide synthase [Roseibium aquae]GGB49000.1 type I polyketide synthase [Roseibium aquae]